MSINKIFKPIEKKTNKIFTLEKLFNKYETVEVSGFYNVTENLFSVLHIAPIGHRDRVQMEFDLEKMSYHTHLSPKFYDYPKGLEPQIPSSNDLWLYFEHFEKMNEKSWVISPKILTCMTYNVAKSDLEAIKKNQNLHFGIRTYLSSIVLMYMDRENTKFSKEFLLVFLNNFSSEKLLSYLDNHPQYRAFLSKRFKATSGQTLDFFYSNPIPEDTYSIKLSFYENV